MAFFAKVALRAGADPFTFLVGRFGLASVVLALTLAVTRPPRPPRRVVQASLGLGALVYSGQAIALTYALTDGAASVVAVLFATYPTLVVLGVACTRGRTAVGRRHLIALAGVLLGVVMVIGPDTERDDPSAGCSPRAPLCRLLRRVRGRSRHARSDGRSHTPGDPRMRRGHVQRARDRRGDGRARRVSRHPGMARDRRSWRALDRLAFLGLFAALPRTGPVTAGIVLGAEPVVTIALGVTVLGDHLTVTQGLGIALVVAAVAVLSAVTSRTSRVPAV